MTVGVPVGPRPGFVLVAQSNLTNGVLTAFRAIPPTSRVSCAEGFLAEAERLPFPSWKADEVAHACRVVSRWLIVQENSPTVTGTVPGIAMNEEASS